MSVFDPERPLHRGNMTSYRGQWKALRRLERCLFSWLIGWPVLLLAVMLLATPQLIGVRSAATRDIDGYIFIGLWGGVALLLRVWLGTIKCPRCGFSFYGGERVPRKTCAHCSLDRKSAQ